MEGKEVAVWGGTFDIIKRLNRRKGRGKLSAV
jgi:hypothetical protein